MHAISSLLVSSFVSFVIFGAGGRCLAQTDWEIGPFVRPEIGNPIISPKADSVFDCPMRKTAVHWEAGHTFNPTAVVYQNKVFLLYRSEDTSGQNHIGGHTSRLGLAESEDGIHFTRHPEPVLYPADDEQKASEWTGGCEDPRAIATADGTFILTYTQFNGNVARLGVATSKDLVHWTKHGSAFTGEMAKRWSKSGAIVGKLVDGQLLATQINGKYWMYFGEGAVDLASSTDLIHWIPVEKSPGKLLQVIPVRPGKFDSDLSEGGPPAVLTDKGIVVLYNGKNGGHGDKALDPGAYAGGQALFDASDPTKLVAKLDSPFFFPKMPFEKSGQYGAGTTFIEGLVPFHGKWFLYYGCADSLVGVAVCQKL